MPIIEAEVPDEAIEAELDALRSSVAELVPVEGRPAQPGDTLVIDVLEPGGNVQRDLVVELGSGRLLEEIESGLVGAQAGDTRAIEVELADDSRQAIEVTVKELKEKVLPPADDELARAATEFDTLEELRADIEQRIRAQLDLEIESAFRTAVADALVDAANVDAARPARRGPRAGARARPRPLARRPRGQRRRLPPAHRPEHRRGAAAPAHAEAERSVARELVLEAIADELDIQVSDDELREFLREEASPGEDAEALIDQVFQAGRQETLRDDLRLRRALDRAASEVKRIPAELAAAREKLWTPEKERPKTETKLWTPGSKEP